MTAQTTTAQGAGPVAAERGRDARRGLRTCGAIGIGAGLLFGAMTVWEHAVGPAVPGGMPGPIIRSGFVLARNREHDSELNIFTLLQLPLFRIVSPGVKSGV